MKVQQFFALSLLALSTLTLSTTQAAQFVPAAPSDAPAGLTYNVQQPPVQNSEELAGKRVAILSAHGVQESELKYPYDYLEARGAKVEIVVPSWSSDKILAVSYLRPTLWVTADHTFEQALKNKYDLIILTGGAWNSTVVRKDDFALKLIKQNFKSGVPIAAICSGVQILIDADLATGVQLTGTGSIKTDLINAGAVYQDVPAMTDGKIITGRGPADALEFMTEVNKAL